MKKPRLRDWVQGKMQLAMFLRDGRGLEIDLHADPPLEEDDPIALAAAFISARFLKMDEIAEMLVQKLLTVLQAEKKIVAEDAETYWRLTDKGRAQLEKYRASGRYEVRS